MTRLEMIGEIRTLLPELWAQGRFELAKEIMGGIHQDDFRGVDERTVRQIWSELTAAVRSLPDD